MNADDEIYRWNGNVWDQVPGSLKQISVGNADSVWGVNSDDEIYRWMGNSWMQVSGALKHVSVGDDTVWGVNADDEIYRWNGNGWDQVSGSLKQISVGNAGSVWGVNSDDEIYRRDGSRMQVSGALKHVSVASDDTVWGVNEDDEIYRGTGGSGHDTITPTDPNAQIGQRTRLSGGDVAAVAAIYGPAPAWLPVDGSLKYVSTASDGTVWANGDDEIYRWNGSSWDRVLGLAQADLGRQRGQGPGA